MERNPCRSTAASSSQEEQATEGKERWGAAASVDGGERSGLNLLPEGHHNQDETMESHLLSKQQGMKTRYEVPDEREKQTS